MGFPIGSETGTTTTPTVQDFSRHVTIWNMEAAATLGYRLTNNASVELGYRVDYFNNMLPVITQVSASNITGGVLGGGSVLVHGPVAKLTIGWK